MTVLLAGLLVLNLTVSCGTRPSAPQDWSGHARDQWSSNEAKDVMREAEHAVLLGAEVVVVGSVVRVIRGPSYATPNLTSPYGVLVEVEDWIRGCCSAGSLAVYSKTGMGRGRQPKRNERYIFLADEVVGGASWSWDDHGYAYPVSDVYPSADDGLYLRSDSEKHRFHLRDGCVAGRDESEGVFISRLRDCLASREPTAVYRDSEIVLQGEVIEHRPQGNGSTGGSVTVHVREVLKSTSSVPDTITVSWPSRRWSDSRDAYLYADFPEFREHEDTVLFLCDSGEGRFSLAAGSASKLRVRPDGSFWSYRDTEDFLSAIGAAGGEAPN